MDLLLAVVSLVLIGYSQPDVIQMQENTTVSGCRPPDLTGDPIFEPHLPLYPINFNVTITCVNSTLIGETEITCFDTGQWSSTETYCKKTHCDMPSIPANYITEFRENDKNMSVDVKYSCISNFQLVGKETRQCLPNGTYSGPLPKCLKICESVHVPINGSVHTECLHANCTAIFMCHNGFQLTGDHMSKCSEDGKWIHDVLPQCKKIYCPSPPEVENTSINVNVSQELFPYGTQVIYACLYNFTLFGNSTLRCGRSGKWQGQQPYCVVTPPLPVTPTITSIEPQPQTTHNTQQIVTEIIKCPTPQPLVNGHFNVHGQITLLYKCNYGYTLIGIHERTCLENKTWSHKAPTCVPGTENLEHAWRNVFSEFREWEGVYVYWQQPTHFKLWVVENRHPGLDHLEVLFDDDQAKLYVKVTYNSGALRFELTRLFTQSERFQPGHKWAFEGYLRKHTGHWQFVANAFHTDHQGFEKLHMSPKKVYEPPPPIPQITEPDVNVIALSLGIIIAMVLIIVAATLAAFFVKRKAMKATGHRSVTSFENPVYDYQNSLKDQEQYQEPTEC